MLVIQGLGNALAERQKLEKPLKKCLLLTAFTQAAVAAKFNKQTTGYIDAELWWLPHNT